MLALALILIALGIMLIHAAITGKPVADILTGSENLKPGSEPTLATE